MGNNQTVWMVAIFLSVYLGLTACERADRGVEAAREDAAGRDVMILSPSEQLFMTETVQANLKEIDVARLAQQKSKNNRVKNYAEMIVDDHTDALVRLSNLMEEKNVSPPKTLSDQTKADIARMSELSGVEFDREFINMMVDNHRKSVQSFRNQAISAVNPDVEEYVNGVLPTLEKHLNQAQEIQSELFGGHRL